MKFSELTFIIPYDTKIEIIVNGSYMGKFLYPVTPFMDLEIIELFPVNHNCLLVRLSDNNE